MEELSFRTYKRRPVTRRSGFKVTGNTTGGECIILSAQKYICENINEKFVFYREKVKLTNLFEKDFGIIAFGGYIHSIEKFNVNFKLTYSIPGINKKFEFSQYVAKSLNEGTWNAIGFHKEVSFDIMNSSGSDEVYDVCVEMVIESHSDNNILQFIGFDFDAINYDGYLDSSLFEHFKKKTLMHVPQIYYLRTDLPFSTYLVSPQSQKLEIGEDVVLKGCNRCDRYLPININDEINTLSFSLHCKKKAPCTHSLFSSYRIDNIDELKPENLEHSYIKNGFVHSYYGHQLECTACKKYYVNGALNKLRDSQQFREDSLRRRALEVLVNKLLERNIVHFEFRNKNKKEFSEYIWEKFGKRCFKCGKKLSLDEMHLDHTMPLAFLYRLDETATCLCSEHNAKKRDRFPVEFYTDSELDKLQKITGIDKNIIRSKQANPEVVKLLVENVVWFFDEFLNDDEYQKVRAGRLTADKIYASLVRVLNDQVDLILEYRNRTGKYPSTISKQ